MYTRLQNNLKNYCARIERKLLVMIMVMITVVMWWAASLIAGLVCLETYQMVMALWVAVVITTLFIWDICGIRSLASGIPNHITRVGERMKDKWHRWRDIGTSNHF